MPERARQPDANIFNVDEVDVTSTALLQGIGSVK